jgi:hypothetical protein
MSTHDLVPIAEYLTRIEADLGKAILEANEVVAVIAGDDAGGMNPWIHPATPVRLLVHADDAERAREILAAPESEMHGEDEA